MKILAASALFLALGMTARADSTGSDYVIQVTGGLTADGESFSVGYQADLSGYQKPYGLVDGTLEFSSSGSMGTFAASPYNVNYPEGGLWQDLAGDQIVLQLFRTPGCGTTADAECEPEIGPAEGFAPGFTDADLNAFANGVFELIPAGQTFSPGMFGDVQVSFVPEPHTIPLLLCAMAVLIVFRKYVKTKVA